MFIREWPSQRLPRSMECSAQSPIPLVSSGYRMGRLRSWCLAEKSETHMGRLRVCRPSPSELISTRAHVGESGKRTVSVSELRTLAAAIDRFGELAKRNHVRVLGPPAPTVRRTGVEDIWYAAIRVPLDELRWRRSGQIRCRREAITQLDRYMSSGNRSGPPVSRRRIHELTSPNGCLASRRSAGKWIGFALRSIRSI